MKPSKLVSESLSGTEIQTVTQETFDQLVLNGAGPIAVEFMSYSCEHCRAMEPVLKQVAEMVKSKGTIFKVNIATDPELGDRCGVKATPTLVMFLDGNIVGRSEGPSPTVSSIMTAIAQPFRATQ